MSKNKCPSIFSRQMEAIVCVAYTAYIILRIFFAKHAILKIEKYHSDIKQLLDEVEHA